MLLRVACTIVDIDTRAMTIGRVVSHYRLTNHRLLRVLLPADRWGGPKGGFDLLLLGVSCLSIFGNAYLAAFEVDDSNIYFTIVDLLVEGLFLADIIFNFL